MQAPSYHKIDKLIAINSKTEPQVKQILDLVKITLVDPGNSAKLREA